jgi:hypothetical protein
MNPNNEIALENKISPVREWECQVILISVHNLSLTRIEDAELNIHLFFNFCDYHLLSNRNTPPVVLSPSR